MKAAVYAKTASGKSLEIQDVEQPVPKDHEVVLRVRAASVNPLDWRLKRHRPGVDVAGEVVAIGRKVTRFKPGDFVFGAGKAAFAEYASAREANLILKAQNITFEQAAAVPIAGLTALQGLRDKGRLRPGQKLMINGAAGGVGTFAVQIAKSFGATVTGVCSTRNVELVRSLGADRVIDYTRDDFTGDSEHYDLILDNVANRRLSALKRILRPGGKVVMVGAAKEFGAVFAGMLELLVRSLLLRQNFTFFLARIRPADLTSVSELIAAGKVTPVIDRCCALRDVGSALAYVEQGHARGKVIIRFE